MFFWLVVLSIAENRDKNSRFFKYLGMVLSVMADVCKQIRICAKLREFGIIIRVSGVQVPLPLPNFLNKYLILTNW